MSEILPFYPEKDIWKLDPPLNNLTPKPPDESSDTTAFHHRARRTAQLSAINPLHNSYGPSPFIMRDLASFTSDIPMNDYREPPPLNEVKLSAKLVFLEEINPNGNTPVFKVQIGEAVRLLKIFPDRPVPLDMYRKPEEAPEHPLVRFEREKIAYAHLVHHGACTTGSVPQCYGWLDITAEDLDNMERIPNISRRLACMDFKKDNSLPRALLLEYFDNAERLSIDNVTPEVADRALRSLYCVHASYIKHGDVSTRNILVLPKGRVVLVDFDSSEYIGGNRECPLRRQSLLLEMSRSWSMFYRDLLPDKRIGFRSWL